MPPETSFLLLGEPLALDLANTRVRQAGATVDLLETPAALARWLAAQHGRLAWHGRAGKDELATVQALRDTIEALLTAHETSRHPSASVLRRFNQALDAGRETEPRLGWNENGPHVLSSPAAVGLAGLCHILAVDALELLTGPDAARIRRCAHPECILRFVARNSRRRWCDGAVCGNRARVARHYARHGRQEAGASG